MASEGERYVTVRGTAEIPAGETFSAKEIEPYLFETLPTPSGEKRYLLGIYTDKAIENLSIGGLKLPLHRCRTDDWSMDGDYCIWRSKQIPVVHHCRYEHQEPKLSYDLFAKMGEMHRDAPDLIFSILSNGGGDSNYPKHFIEGLNDYARWNVSVACINNPLLNHENLDL